MPREVAIVLREWCPEADLNHRHADFQSAALPTELSGHPVQEPEGGTRSLPAKVFSNAESERVIPSWKTLSSTLFAVFCTGRKNPAAGMPDGCRRGLFLPAIRLRMISGGERNHGLAGRNNGSWPRCGPDTPKRRAGAGTVAASRSGQEMSEARPRLNFSRDRRNRRPDCPRPRLPQWHSRRSASD
jgi:hypothetical protein